MELWRHRTKLDRLHLPLLLVWRVPILNLDQPNHLFLWACSQATKCNWGKLALKQIYSFQADLDCQCCSVILFTFLWLVPFPISNSSCANILSFFFRALTHSLYLCMHSTTVYWVLTMFQALFRGLWKIKICHNFCKTPLIKKVGSILFPPESRPAI